MPAAFRGRVPPSRTCGEASRPRRAGSDLGSHGFRLIDEGTLFNAGQQTGIASNVLFVPTDVVQHGENGLYVFIIDNQNRAKVRQVKIAHQETRQPSSRMA